MKTSRKNKSGISQRKTTIAGKKQRPPKRQTNRLTQTDTQGRRRARRGEGGPSAPGRRRQPPRRRMRRFHEGPREAVAGPVSLPSLLAIFLLVHRPLRLSLLRSSFYYCLFLFLDALTLDLFLTSFVTLLRSYSSPLPSLSRSLPPLSSSLPLSLNAFVSIYVPFYVPLHIPPPLSSCSLPLYTFFIFIPCNSSSLCPLLPLFPLCALF